MTDEQLAVLDAGLRMIQEANINPNTVDLEVRQRISKYYSTMDSRSLGRKIVAEAIARRGYFSTES